VAAVVTLAMVFNFHFATSAFSWEFLRDGTGPPVLGGLMALAIAGRQLPFCVTWPAAAQETIRYSAAKAAS
jgi:hypothetical protein